MSDNRVSIAGTMFKRSGAGGYYGGSWPRCAFVILSRMISE